MNNKLLIEVSQEDHALVESICSEGVFTFASFFSHLLTLYKNSLTDPVKELEKELEINLEKELKINENLEEKVKNRKKKY